MRALLLPVGGDAYAVGMQAAREVVEAPEVTPLPTAPASVVGVINLRGEIVPVFDTARLLGLAASTPAYAVVVETSLGPAGLTMTGMGESVDLGEPVGVADTPGAMATYAVGDRLVVLLDVETLLAPTHVEG